MIPAFIPAHLFWAYFTGAGHIAAGVAILTSVLARLGAILFAAMVSGFVLLLHVPRVHRRAGQPRRVDDARDRDDHQRRRVVHGWKSRSQGRQAGLILRSACGIACRALCLPLSCS